jgi:hypothetical protein
MHMIKIPAIKDILKHVVVDLHEPVGFLGQFGAGKTEGVEHYAKEMGAHVCKILLGQYDTVDLKGTPWVVEYDQEGEASWQATVWRPASTLPFKGNPNFPKDKPIFLFLDEITSATVPVMGVCYQLVHERRVGEHELMDNVFVMVAGNREVDKGIVNRMPMPLANRIIWFEVGVDPEAWCQWAQRKYGEAASIFMAFILFRKALLCTYDPAKPEKTVATPRTWEKCIKLYSHALMGGDTKRASMAGAVGDGPSAEFWGFVDVWQKVVKLIESIKKNPEKADVPDEPSLQYAIAISLSGDMTSKTAKLINTYLMRMPAEFVVIAWQLAITRDNSLLASDEFVTFSRKHKVVFS